LQVAEQPNRTGAGFSQAVGVQPFRFVLGRSFPVPLDRWVQCGTVLVALPGQRAAQEEHVGFRGMAVGDLSE
jgi:hypothetical protein